MIEYIMYEGQEGAAVHREGGPRKDVSETLNEFLLEMEPDWLRYRIGETDYIVERKPCNGDTKDIKNQG